MASNAENILIVGPAWVGDMVMAQSLFRVLKKRHPDTRIDVIAPAWTLPLLDRMPEVNRVVAMPLGHGQLGLKARWRLGKSLRDQQYDQAIVLPRSLKSAIIPLAAGARRRTGFLGELRWGLLNDVRKLDKLALPKTVDRFMALGLDPNQAFPQSFSYPSIQADPANARTALKRLEHKLTGGHILGLSPGAEYGPAKRWPEGHFAELANKQLDENWEVWIFGSEKDAVVAATIQEKTVRRCLDLTGKTSLLEAVDLMAMTSCMVTNDSGLMHIAAALDLGVVAIYGSSDPGNTPPLSDKAIIVRLDLGCSPCLKRECPYGHYRCLKGISADLVTEKIKTVTTSNGENYTYN